MAERVDETEMRNRIGGGGMAPLPEDTTDETGSNDDLLTANISKIPKDSSLGDKPRDMFQQRESTPKPKTIGRKIGVIRNFETNERKNFLKNQFNIIINKGDGNASKEIFKNLILVYDSKEGKKVVGATFKGTKIIVRKGKGVLCYTTDDKKQSVVEEFKELAEKAGEEYKKNINAQAEEAVMDVIVGPQGERRPPGQVGAQGERGKTGKQGERGLPGQDGKQGERGLPGQVGSQGERGKTGKQGERGLPGKVGPQGLPGVDGAQGERTQGERGLPGKTGKQGEHGLPGVDGAQGERGLPGERGPPWADGVSEAHVNAVIRELYEAISDKIDDLRDQIQKKPNLSNNEGREIRTSLFTFDERRELNGISEETVDALPTAVITGKLEAYEKDAEHWQTLAEAEPEGSDRQAAFKSAARVSRLLEDQLRLRMGRRVVSQEAFDVLQEVVEKSDITRFERFKVWAKKNLGTLSVVTITVAGIVTSIVMGFRKAVVQGARATGKFAKALANIAAKVGPIVGAVLNLIGSVLGLGAKGILWISRNLWILAVFIAYWLMERYKRSRRNR